jgi:hypothetical protein
MTVDSLVFEDILNKPQVDALNADGVAELDQALQDLLNNPGSNFTVNVRSRGSLDTTNNVVFTMLVEFTITAIVQKELTKLSPLG